MKTQLRNGGDMRAIQAANEAQESREECATGHRSDASVSDVAWYTQRVTKGP